jgi:hypothetical protein
MVATVTARALALSLSLVALGCEEPATSERGAGESGTLAATVAEAPELDPPAEANGARSDTGGPEAPERSPVAVQALPGADQPGPVYLAIAGRGLVRFDGSGASVVVSERRTGPIDDLFVGPDGRVYLRDSVGLRRIDGGGGGSGGAAERVVEVARFGQAELGQVDSLALGPDGEVWVIGGRRLATHAGRGWQLQPREHVAIGIAAEIVLGHDGTAWLFDAGRVSRRRAESESESESELGGGADEWTAVDIGALGRGILLLHPSPSPSGAILASDGERLIRLTRDAAEPEQIGLVDPSESGTLAYTRALAIAGDGTLALASGGCALVRFGPDGRGERIRVGPEAYTCATLEGLAVDTQARLWVASREGLSVLDPAGWVREYPAGSFAELAGPVAHMVVVGQGPAQLPDVPELARAHLRGQILVGAEPLADAAIEACPSVRLQTEGSPCSAAATRLRATSDGEGRFELREAAIGDYGFAVEIAGQWRWTTPPSFAASLRAGETHELGPLRFDGP